MSRIAENIRRIQQEIDEKAKLIVVSKYREIQEIEAAYDFGIRSFAENRVQALLERYEMLPKDIEWHLIGHLQSNKVKYIAEFIAMIHSVDSIKLLEEINVQAAKFDRKIPCLIQLHLAQEESKFGIPPNEIKSFFDAATALPLPHVQISGLMAMATFTEDKNLIKSEFEQAQLHFSHIKSQYFSNEENFKELSIGMSGDYMLAIEHGSTMVRIGSACFG
jgi:pyridoxal phosphate enzyme (YggS family)